MVQSEQETSWETETEKIRAYLNDQDDGSELRNPNNDINLLLDYVDFLREALRKAGQL